MRRVRVALARAPYEVVIGGGALFGPDLGRCMGRGACSIVVSSRKVMKLHGPALKRALQQAGFEARAFVLLADGEAAKTTRAWEKALAAMARARLDRRSFVIAFGGGSIGDVAGFAAASYMRGIRVIQIPTTLLSMVDSSVGGKTGINLKEGKNLVGAFHQPSLVIADLSFLRTLPSRERQSGVYEMLKCGFLRSRSLVALLESTRGLRDATEAQLERAITLAVEVKARIVEGDERESGKRVLLNLGHTLGHALEAATSYQTFTHGEAVGYGMEFAVDLGVKLGITRPASATQMLRAIREVGPRSPLRLSMVQPSKRATLGDKKRTGPQLNEVFLARAQSPRVKRIPALAFAEEAGLWLADRAQEAHRRKGPPSRPSVASKRLSGRAGDYRPAGKPTTAYHP